MNDKETPCQYNAVTKALIQYPKIGLKGDRGIISLQDMQWFMPLYLA